MKHSNEKETLLDRFSVGLMCGVLTLVTLSVVWCLFAFFGLYFDGEFWFHYPKTLIFSAVLVTSLLGFISKENIVLNLLTWLWHWIAKWYLWLF